MDSLEWWKTAVFYQIYPRSFADSNGDGIGDLPGIIGKLDYLQDLGVDAIWLSPHYPSPMWDCGYDISDYTTVAPEYGTLDDFRRLLDGLHRRGMHLVTDLVLNHTSDRHPWFQESRSGRDNPKRDWYIWRDGKNGGPPNNWYSAFGGPAWEPDAITGQYYYHYFFKQQPDLNWRHPQVREAMFDVMRFWLDMGVDGFRLDAIGTIFEDPGLTDQSERASQTELYRRSRTANTPAERRPILQAYRRMFKYQHDYPEIYDLMRQLRRVVDAYPDRMLVGETEMLEYYGNGSDQLHLVFNFPLMHTPQITPAWVRGNQRLRLSGLPRGAWPCNTLGNHDSPRIASRYGDGIHDAAIARVLPALMLTLWGTPFLYNGEEIGMTDLSLEDLAQFRDMLGVWAYETEIERLGSAPEAALAQASLATRDKNRTPFQWGNKPNAGFCPEGVKPWLPVNPNYAEGINLADQQAAPHSLFNYYRKLLQVRRNTPALVVGDYRPIGRDARYLAFLRADAIFGQTCLVALNMVDKIVRPRLDLPAKRLELIFSSCEREKQAETPDSLCLEPYEVYIAKVDG